MLLDLFVLLRAILGLVGTKKLLFSSTVEANRVCPCLPSVLGGQIAFLVVFGSLIDSALKGLTGEVRLIDCLKSTRSLKLLGPRRDMQLKAICA